jgi:hypothetical protein
MRFSSIQVSGLQRESLELELERGGGQPDLLACLVVHNLIRRALEVRLVTTTEYIFLPEMKQG